MLNPNINKTLEKAYPVPPKPLNRYSSMQKPLKIAFVANTSWSLFNFRLGILKYLNQQRGVEILLIGPVDNFTSKLVAEGFHFEPISLENYSTNPISDIKLTARLFNIYRKEKPDFIFHYTIKLNLYGTLAAWFSRVPSVAVTTGLGRLLSTKNSWIRFYANNMYKLTGLLAKEIWFLNQADVNYFLEKKLISKNKARLVPSEGVNVDIFKSISQKTSSEKKISFLFAGRLIKEKGVLAFVKAAKSISEKKKNVTFNILGFIEPKNPGGLKISQIKNWQNEGFINFLGDTDDIRPFIDNSDCVVLPSYYGEGVPRILLEASAMAKPVITTNITGCRETVTDRVTGFLCEPKNENDLISKIEEFIALSPEDRKIMGQAGRKKIEKEFSEKQIIKIYESFLDELFPKLVKPSSKTPRSV